MPTTRLNLDVQSGTDALHRVLCVCRRRGLEVIALAYRDQRIVLTLAGKQRQISQIHRWLSGVVNVVDVQVSEPTASGEVSGVDASYV